MCSGHLAEADGVLPTQTDLTSQVLGKQLLFEGKVVETYPKSESGYRATIEITHVYRGPDRFKGRLFDDFASDATVTVGPHSPWPPFEKGEVGIWGVFEYQGVLRTGYGQYMPFTSAVRKGRSQRFEQIKALVEGIEQLERLELVGQVKLARQFAVSKSSELSRFAILALGRVKLEGIGEFFDELTDNDKMPIGAAIALDEVLLKSRERSWATSRRRMDWLSRWVRRIVTFHEAYEATNHLTLAAQHGQLGVVDLIRLLDELARNPHCSLEGRRTAVNHVGGIAASPGFETGFTEAEKELAINWLANQVQNHANLDIRIKAAGVLTGLASVDKDERAAVLVRKLLLTVADEKIRTALSGLAVVP